MRALVQGGVRVDEDTVMRAYEVSLDLVPEQEENEETERVEYRGESRDFLGAMRGTRVVERVVEALRDGGGKR